MPTYYLVETRSGRWGRKEYIYKAYIEVKLPNGKIKVWQITQWHPWTKTPPRADSSWRLSRGNMKFLFANTKAKDWHIQVLRSFDGMIDGVRESDNLSWGIPNFKRITQATHGEDRHYDYLVPMGYFHCWSVPLGTYNLKPMFSIRILPKLPKHALKKTTQTEIPRFGTMKPINIMLLLGSQLKDRLSLLVRSSKAIDQNLEKVTAPSKLKHLRERKKTVIQEISKVVNELEKRQEYQIRRFAFQVTQKDEGKIYPLRKLSLSLQHRHYKVKGQHILFSLMATTDTANTADKIRVEGKKQGFYVRIESRKRTPKFRIYMKKEEAVRKISKGTACRDIPLKSWNKMNKPEKKAICKKCHMKCDHVLRTGLI